MTLDIPTNIISGFLGVGKTTAIQSLLRRKPSNERWAVLVNEFGEIGVDSEFLKASELLDNNVYFKEVAGGCMCCTAGLSMQIALNQLLSRARPHRLLIEPSGLGHPKEVLETLSESHNKKLIGLKATITLVDARVLIDERYLSYETFKQQIECADIIVGNKSDLYGTNDRSSLQQFVDINYDPNVKVVFSEQGVFDLALLDLPSKFIDIPSKKNKKINTIVEDLVEPPIPDCGYVRALNTTSDFSSLGYRFDARFKFDLEQLRSLINEFDLDRFKGIVRTNVGCKILNWADGTLTEISVAEFSESRLEMLGTDLPEHFDIKLMDALIFK